MTTTITTTRPQLVRFDWAMKYLLRNKANFDVLEGFLSELLKTQIHIEKILESEGNQQQADDKYNRVDVLVDTAEGQKIIIEVQCASEWDYLSRILYGASKVVCEYIREGEPYKNIGKVISVSIVFFNLGSGTDYLYHGCTTFTGLHSGDLLDFNPQEREFYEAAQLPLARQTPSGIFPEYYIIKVTQFHERVKDKLDEWIYLLKHNEIKQEFTAQGIQSASKKLHLLHLSEKERRIYDKYREGLHDEASFNEMVKMAQRKAEEKGLKKGHKKGLAKGLAKGLEEGLAKGLEEGLAKGLEEGLVKGHEAGLEKGLAESRKQIARSLKKAGLPDQEIAKHTGLSIEEINSLF